MLLWRERSCFVLLYLGIGAGTFVLAAACVCWSSLAAGSLPHWWQRHWWAELTWFGVHLELMFGFYPNYLFIYIWVHSCCLQTLEKRASYPITDNGIDIRTSGRAVSALNCWAISPAQCLFYFYILYLRLLLVCMCASAWEYAPQCACGGQRIACWGWSPLPLWVPGLRLRLSGLAASASIC